MDHLVQVPQVGRAWDPIPEPWVALGMLAGLGTGLRLGPLVTPVTFRPAGVTAKAAATLSALTGGRTFLGVGAGWWSASTPRSGSPSRRPGAARRARARGPHDARPVGRRHQGVRRRPRRAAGDDLLPAAARTGPGLVGGGGERRTLRIAAELGDACNLTTTDPEAVARKVAVLRRHCLDVGRDPDDVAVTVLDVPVVGRDRDDVWARVERLRGRTAASTFAARSHAGTVAQQRDRHAALAALGVSTVFLTTPDLAGPDDVLALAGLLR